MNACGEPVSLGFNGFEGLKSAITEPGEDDDENFASSDDDDFFSTAGAGGHGHGLAHRSAASLTLSSSS